MTIIWALKSDRSNGGPSDTNEVEYSEGTLVAIHLPRNCIVVNIDPTSPELERELAIVESLLMGLRS